MSLAAIMFLAPVGRTRGDIGTTYGTCLIGGSV